MKKRHLLLLLLLASIAAVLCPLMAVRASLADSTPPRYTVQGIEVPDDPLAGMPKTFYQDQSEICLDSIRHWVGTGSKRAAIILMDAKRVIGVRWDGKLSGLSALWMIAREDPRYFFAGYNGAILLMGWDVNEDGKFEIAPEDKTFTDGYCEWGSYTLTGTKVKDPEDYWWGAWGMNYWRYYTKDPGQDSFVYSNVGAGGRELKDGSMDQWYGNGDRGEQRNIYVDKPIDYSKLAKSFEQGGVRYVTIDKAWQKHVKVLGNTTGYNGAVILPRFIYEGDYCFIIQEVVDSAFFGSAITSVKLEDRLAKIGKYAFANCGNLTIGEIPKDLTDVPAGMYARSPLDSIVVNGEKTPGDQLTAIGTEAFMNTKLRTFPTNNTKLTKYGDRAFKNSGQTTLTLPAVAVEIGVECFNGCPLQKVPCQSFAAHPVPDNAFSAKTYANAILYVPYGAEANYRAAAGWKNFANIQADPTITPTVGGLTVQDGITYKILTETTATVYPNTTDAAGNLCGTDYSGVINIPDSIQAGEKKFAVKEVEKNAFRNSTLKEITFTATTTEFNYEAFSHSTVEKVTAPGLVTLRNGVFRACNRLSELNCGQINGVWEYALDSCILIKDLDLSHVSVIGIYGLRHTGISDANLSNVSFFRRQEP